MCSGSLCRPGGRECAARGSFEGHAASKGSPARVNGEKGRAEDVFRAARSPPSRPSYLAPAGRRSSRHALSGRARVRGTSRASCQREARGSTPPELGEGGVISRGVMLMVSASPCHGGCCRSSP